DSPLESTGSWRARPCRCADYPAEARLAGPISSGTSSRMVLGTSMPGIQPFQIFAATLDVLTISIVTALEGIGVRPQPGADSQQRLRHILDRLRTWLLNIAHQRTHERAGEYPVRVVQTRQVFGSIRGGLHSVGEVRDRVRMCPQRVRVYMDVSSLHAISPGQWQMAQSSRGMADVRMAEIPRSVDYTTVMDATTLTKSSEIDPQQLHNAGLASPR